jgi:hypothetical protein
MLDGLLTWAVLALAWWTALFHVATPLGWHRDVVGGLWVGGLGVALLVVVAARSTAGSSEPEHVTPVRPRVGRRVGMLLAAAVAAAALSATRWPDERPHWWVFWAGVLAISGGAVAVVSRARPVPAGGDVGAPGDAGGEAGAADAGDEARGAVPAGRHVAGPSAVAVAVVVSLAALAAFGSAFTQRPDADDVFLVNRSTYVAENAGPLPERDTLFSDEVFAVTRPDTVATSFEALVGVAAAWSPVTAPTLTYLLVAPAVAALAIVALWRMLRTLGAGAPAAATVVASAFLLLDGGNHTNFGNFHFARAWQGKVVFLIVVVPLLWHYGLRWARDGNRRDLGLLLAANVAGIGLTTTAAWVAPSVTAIVVFAGSWAVGIWRRLVPGLAAAVPPVLAASAFAILPRQDPSVAHRVGDAAGLAFAWIPPWFTLGGGIDPGEEWHFVFDGGVALLIPVVAALTAWAFVTDRAARLALALAPLVLFGVFYGPGTFDAIADVSGVETILWRSAWILPVPAAVGLALTAPLLLPASLRRWLLAGAVPAVVLIAMAVGSTWVLDSDNRGMRVGSIGWDVDPSDRGASDRLIALSEPGDVILAPEGIGGAIAIQTTQVRAVNPRGQYMTGRHVVPEFMADERRFTSEAVVLGLEDDQAADFRDAVGALEVDTACVSVDLDDPGIDGVLADLGFTRVDADARCTYWRRSAF